MRDFRDLFLSIEDTGAKSGDLTRHRSITFLPELFGTVVIAGMKLVIKGKNGAFCDKFLNFGMVLGMGIRFSKTTANDMGTPPSGLFAQNSKFHRSVNG